MEVALVAIADAANVTASGKLNICGTFDTLFAASVPVSHPAMALAFSVRAESEDSNKKVPLEAMLIDEDGQILFAAQAEIQTKTVLPGQFGHLPQVVELKMVNFPRYGRYRFRVRFPGTDIHGDAVFQVVRTRPQ